jgi:hypothetical protein
MPTYQILNRQRVRARARGRPDAPGNFITALLYATVWYLQFSETKAHYIKSVLYKFPSTKAIGYYDNPPPSPAWKLLVAQSSYQQAVYDPTAQAPPRSTISNVPQGANPSYPVRGRPGMTGIFIPGIVPKQLLNTKLAVLSFDVLALQANALNIWYGYSPNVAKDNGFKLIPGSGKELDIGDLSQVWFVGENATDGFCFDYTQ